MKIWKQNTALLEPNLGDYEAQLGVLKMATRDCWFPDKTRLSIEIDATMVPPFVSSKDDAMNIMEHIALKTAYAIIELLEPEKFAVLNKEK